MEWNIVVIIGRLSYCSTDEGHYTCYALCVLIPHGGTTVSLQLPAQYTTTIYTLQPTAPLIPDTAGF